MFKMIYARFYANTKTTSESPFRIAPQHAGSGMMIGINLSVPLPWSAGRGRSRAASFTTIASQIESPLAVVGGGVEKARCCSFAVRACVMKGTRGPPKSDCFPP